MHVYIDMESLTGFSDVRIHLSQGVGASHLVLGGLIDGLSGCCVTGVAHIAGGDDPITQGGVLGYLLQQTCDLHTMETCKLM